MAVMKQVILMIIVFSASCHAEHPCNEEPRNICPASPVPGHHAAKAGTIGHDGNYCPRTPRNMGTDRRVCDPVQVSPRLTASEEDQTQYKYLLDHLGDILQNFQVLPTPVMTASRSASDDLYEHAPNCNCDKSSSQAQAQDQDPLHPASAFRDLIQHYSSLISPDSSSREATPSLIPPMFSSKIVIPPVHHIVSSFVTPLINPVSSLRGITTSPSLIPPISASRPVITDLFSSFMTLLPPIAFSRQAEPTLIPPVSSSRVLSSSYSHLPGCGCSDRPTPSLATSSSSSIPTVSSLRDVTPTVPFSSTVIPPTSSTRVLSYSSVVYSHRPGCGCSDRPTPSLPSSSSSSIPTVSSSRVVTPTVPFSSTVIPPTSSTRVSSSSSVVYSHRPGCGCSDRPTPSLPSSSSSSSRTVSSSRVVTPSVPFSSTLSPPISSTRVLSSTSSSKVLSTSTSSRVFSTKPSTSTVFSTSPSTTSSICYLQSPVVINPILPVYPATFQALIHPTSASRTAAGPTDIPSFNDNLPDDVVATAMSKMFKDLNRAFANSRNENVKDDAEISFNHMYNMMKYFDHYKEYLPYLRSTNENLNRNYNQYPLYSPCQCN